MRLGQEPEDWMLELSADARVGRTLDALGRALEARDIARAVDLFQDECLWRDLVAFTWNIATMEGKDAIRAMLEAQLASAAPSHLAIDPTAPAHEEGGVTTGSFTFE